MQVAFVLSNDMWTMRYLHLIVCHLWDEICPAEWFPKWYKINNHSLLYQSFYHHFSYNIALIPYHLWRNLAKLPVSFFIRHFVSTEIMTTICSLQKFTSDIHARNTSLMHHQLRTDISETNARSDSSMPSPIDSLGFLILFKTSYIHISNSLSYLIDCLTAQMFWANRGRVGEFPIPPPSEGGKEIEKLRWFVYNWGKKKDELTNNIESTFGKKKKRNKSKT